MAHIYSRAELQAAIHPAELIQAMEDGFVAYLRGQVVVPPVGHLDFDEPPGDCHIKYGYIRGDDAFTVKIATGFYRNPDRGLPSSNGVVLVFSSRTGELQAILQDEGYLTDLRTAAAGAVAAKYSGAKEYRVHRHHRRRYAGAVAIGVSASGHSMPPGAGLGPVGRARRGIPGAGFSDRGGGFRRATCLAESINCDHHAGPPLAAGCGPRPARHATSRPSAPMAAASRNSIRVSSLAPCVLWIAANNAPNSATHRMPSKND